MEVSAYLKLFGPDTSLAFGGGRGTFGELLDGNTRCVKKGWSTPRRVWSSSCFAHAGRVESMDGQLRENRIGFVGSMSRPSTLWSLSQVSAMHLEILQELPLSAQVDDEISDNGREGKETGIESVRLNQGTAVTGIFQRVGRKYTWVAAITHSVIQYTSMMNVANQLIGISSAAEAQIVHVECD